MRAKDFQSTNRREFPLRTILPTRSLIPIPACPSISPAYLARLSYWPILSACLPVSPSLSFVSRACLTHLSFLPACFAQSPRPIIFRSGCLRTLSHARFARPSVSPDCLARLLCSPVSPAGLAHLACLSRLSHLLVSSSFSPTPLAHPDCLSRPPILVDLVCS